MKKMLALAVLGMSLVAVPAANAGPQQEKMKMCSRDAKAKSLKGAERKAFMKKCLSKPHKADAGKKPAAAGTK